MYPQNQAQVLHLSYQILFVFQRKCLSRKYNIKKIMMILLIFSILLIQTSCQIQIDFRKINGLQITNNKIQLRFTVLGAFEPYFIKYYDIPIEWESQNNNLIIKNLDQSNNKNWTFDINVIDASKKQLYQTIRLEIANFQIKVYPVTIALPFSRPTIQSSLAPTQSSVLLDIINRYPGRNQNPSRFNLDFNSNSVLIPQKIMNAQAKFDPQRDTKKITDQQRRQLSSLGRYLTSSKNLINLQVSNSSQYDKLVKLNSSFSSQKQELEILVNNASKCKQSINDLQQKSTKIKLALDDKNTKNQQQNSNIKQGNNKIEQLKKRKFKLTDEKFQLQIRAGSPGFNLYQPQQTFNRCENNKTNRNKLIISLNNQISNNNLQIQIANDSISSANARLSSIDSSLVIVRQKINDLKKQLSEAQKQQESLLKDQSIYGATPTESRKKIQEKQRANLGIRSNISLLQSEGAKQQIRCSQLKKQYQTQKDKVVQKQKRYAQIQAQLNNINDEIKKNEQLVISRDANIKSLKTQIQGLRRLDTQNRKALQQQKFSCSVIQQNKNKQLIILNNTMNLINQQKSVVSQIEKALLNLQQQNKQTKENVDQIIKKNLGSSVKLNDNIQNTVKDTNFFGVGTPAGNNPAGNALGSAFRIDSVQRGSIVIKNISQILSAFYERGIDPTSILDKLVNQTKRESNPTPIPWQTLNEQQRKQLFNNQSELYNQIKDAKCIFKSNPDTIEGIIENYSQGSIIVRDFKSNRYILSVNPPCTNIATNTKGKALKIGNRISFIGERVGIFQYLYNVYFILISE